MSNKSKGLDLWLFIAIAILIAAVFAIADWIMKKPWIWFVFIGIVVIAGILDCLWWRAHRDTPEL